MSNNISLKKVHCTDGDYDMNTEQLWISTTLETECGKEITLHGCDTLDIVRSGEEGKLRKFDRQFTGIVHCADGLKQFIRFWASDFTVINDNVLVKIKKSTESFQLINKLIKSKV